MSKEDTKNIPREKYLLAGAHIGSTFKNKSMERFIYKTRSDGLAVLNIGELDKRLVIAANMMNNAKRVLVVCRKEIGQSSAEKFCELTGYRCFAGRFMPGTMTNPSYKNFYEPDLIVVIDPITDRQAIREAVKMRIPIISICDTVHNTSYIDLILPCNNKGKKSISLVLWGLAKLIKEMKGEEVAFSLEDFGWEKTDKEKLQLPQLPDLQIYSEPSK
ncbi:MAG: 30S ribosomal protein S2 [Candidatus Aenigmarchaeota archaeon]|nr:30S ribosomal protein S2 [Candidatus Aenigmarchaeota archaeon]